MFTLLKVDTFNMIKYKMFFLHLQTEILCLVFETRKAVKQHGSLKGSSLKLQMGSLGPVTQTDCVPVQRRSHPVWHETAPPNIPAVPIMYNETHLIHYILTTDTKLTANPQKKIEQHKLQRSALF